MIDFRNGCLIKLKKNDGFPHQADVMPLFVRGEQFIAEYQSIRDYVVFTDKRIIAVNVQGITGKKKDFSTLPYSKIQAYSVETSGVFDLDAELELYFSSLGQVTFEFSAGSDVLEIQRAIAEHIF